MSERKKSCISFSILPPWSNFIFTATISIYQLINPINTGVYCAPARKAFLQMILSIILQERHSFTRNTLFEKCFFFSKLLSQGSIEQARVRQITVRAYVRTRKIGGRSKVLYN